MSYFAQGQRPSSPFFHSNATADLESWQCRLTSSPSPTAWLSSSLVKRTGAADQWQETTRCLSSGQEQEWWNSVMKGRKEMRIKEIEWEKNLRPTIYYKRSWAYCILWTAGVLSPSLQVSNQKFVVHTRVLFDSSGISLRKSAPKFPFHTQQGVWVSKAHSGEWQYLPPQPPGSLGLHNYSWIH